MTHADSQPTLRVLHALKAVLPHNAQTQLKRRSGHSVELTINGHLLRAYWLGEGRTRRVKEALALAGPERPDVLVSRRMSPGAQDAAAGAGVGWVDEAGGAEVALDWLVLSRSPRIASAVEESAPGWTPATAGVAEAILSGTKPTVKEIRHDTGLSQGLCARALAFLAQQGFLTSEVARGRQSGRQLADLDGLLRAYSEATRAFPRLELRVAVLWRDPVQGLADLGRSWSATGLRWAATGAVAAAVLAPFLTDVGTAEVYVEADTMADLSLAAERIRAKPMEGGRLVLWPFPSAATANLSSPLFHDGLRVAPWPRVYADLLATGVRGEEAAEHLREVVTHARG